MSEEQNFDLPSPTEKLSYKFIMDHLKEGRQEKAAETFEPATESEPEPSLEIIECNVPATSYQPLQLEPGKKYLRIGEVSDLLDVEPYVLRYWESEFKIIRPTKTGSGHRVYSRRDVERLHHIKHLLHVEKFSVKGAKQKLTETSKQAKVEAAPVINKNRQVLKGLAHDLKELIHLAREASVGF